MKLFVSQLVIILALSGALLLTGCSSSGGEYYRSGDYGVYDNYDYPYRGYGYGGCCYDNDRDHNRPDRPERPNRPDRPIRPGDGTSLTRPRPSGGGMGRPARRE